MPFDEEEFETEEDLRALVRARDVERNQSRKARARRKVQRAMEALDMERDGQQSMREGFRRL